MISQVVSPELSRFRDSTVPGYPDEWRSLYYIYII